MALLGLWLKVYRKLQNDPDPEAETLVSSYMSFTYHPIPGRASNIIYIWTFLNNSFSKFLQTGRTLQSEFFLPVWNVMSRPSSHKESSRFHRRWSLMR
jgi:hypothetical protein